MTDEKLQEALLALANQCKEETNAGEVKAMACVLLTAVSAMKIGEHFAFMVHVNKYAAGIVKRAEARRN